MRSKPVIREQRTESPQETLKRLRLEVAGQYGIIAANWASANEKETARLKRDALLKHIETIKGAQ